MKFIQNAFYAAVNKIATLGILTFRHFEAAVVLTLSAIGLNALIGEVPFLVALPMWIESPMVIPVISVIAVTMLIKSAEFRASNRMAMAA